MNGVLAAMLTPLCRDGTINFSRFAQIGKLLIKEGCDGVVPFGTTGEFPSFTSRERMDALDALIAGGVSAKHIIVGAGACAFPDMRELSRHAMDHGCTGVLVGPPFYFKGLSSDALYATYATLIEQVGTDLRLFLYHFPEMSAVPIPFDVVKRLHHDYPDQLAGLKDSAGDFEYSRKLIESFPELAIFTGDDDHLLANLRAGGAGSITAGANLVVRELSYIRDHWNDKKTNSVENKNRLLKAFWSDLLLKFPVTEALKEIFADRSSSKDWLRMRLPLVRLNNKDRATLLKDYSELMINVPAELFMLDGGSVRRN